MNQKEIETRLTEIKYRSNDLNRIVDKYLASNACRTWKEDYLDEDTGEIVSIERNDVIMKRGTLLTNEKVSELNFFFQSGDIKDVEVTTQVRPGIVNDFYTSVLCEAIVSNFPAGTKKYLLHANNLGQAYAIIEDYLELYSSGQNTVKSLKSLGEYAYLRPNRETDEDEMRNVVPFYKAQGEITRTDHLNENREDKPVKETYKFILQANDVKEANDIVKQRLAVTEKHIIYGGERVLRTTTIAAQPYPVTEIVPRMFSEVYIKRDLDSNR